MLTGNTNAKSKGLKIAAWGAFWVLVSGAMILGAQIVTALQNQ